MMMYRLGIDIGGTKINMGLFDDRFHLIASQKYEVKSVVDITAELVQYVDKLCAAAGLSRAHIYRCGVGIPGTVSADGKKILKVPNIRVLTADFAQRLEQALDIPVTMVQDSRAAAWGEYVCGAGHGMDVVICMTLGTGIGTGIVINGQIFAGELGCAGELGHIPVQKNGRPCGCGKRGCLEKYCAGGGLDITAKELLGEGASAKDLFDLAVGGDKRAKDILTEAVEMLGTVLVALVNIFSPGCILLSGGLSTQEELYIKPLIAFVREHCYQTDKLPLIQKAALGENAPLYGAAFMNA